MKRVRAQLARIGRIAAVGAFGATVALVGSVASPTPAEAATLSGHLKNNKTKRCLDADFAGKVYIRQCQLGNNHQTWDISPDQIPADYRKAPDGRSRYEIRNRATGQCLWIAASGDKGVLGTFDCRTARFESKLIDAAGDTFNKVNLRGWHSFTSNRRTASRATTTAPGPSAATTTTSPSSGPAPPAADPNPRGPGGTRPRPSDRSGVDPRDERGPGIRGHGERGERGVLGVAYVDGVGACGDLDAGVSLVAAV